MVGEMAPGTHTLCTGRTLHWYPGELLLFDDSLPHSVQYTSLCEQHASQVGKFRFVSS